MSDRAAALVPLEFDLDRARSLQIRWSDGLLCEIPLALLRANCPCASCRAEREEAASNPLRVLSGRATVEQMSRAETLQPVGTYAIRIGWQDGHDTGIFDYDLLRRLSEQTCVGKPNTARREA